MSSLVSSFENVKIGEFRYLFIIVTLNDYRSEITKEISKQIEPFGADLGLKGLVVKAFKSASYDTAEELLSKKWTEEMKYKIEISRDPIMLVIDKDFNSFDPTEDQWAIIWFADYFKRSDRIYRIFSLLSSKTKKKEDLFQFLKGQTKRENFKKWLNYIEIKPGIFGFNINGTKIFEELI